MERSSLTWTPRTVDRASMPPKIAVGGHLMTSVFPCRTTEAMQHNFVCDSAIAPLHVEITRPALKGRSLPKLFIG
eukprot:m.143046 g.143046  ORF g.143046 m.143046 type:complete len:75 (-) comp17686_c0_seq3:154-378(-)